MKESLSADLGKENNSVSDLSRDFKAFNTRLSNCETVIDSHTKRIDALEVKVVELQDQDLSKHALGHFSDILDSSKAQTRQSELHNTTSCYASPEGFCGCQTVTTVTSSFKGLEYLNRQDPITARRIPKSQERTQCQNQHRRNEPAHSKSSRHSNSCQNHTIYRSLKPTLTQQLNKTYMSLFYQNTRGLNTKLNLVHNFPDNELYDFIIVTESWLKPTLPNNYIFYANQLDVFRDDRIGQRGGGVLIGVKPYLHASIINLAHILDLDFNINIVGIKVIIKSIPLILLAIYCPPDITILQLSTFIDNLQDLHDLQCPNIVIIGDFNAPKFIDFTLGTYYDTKSALFLNIIKSFDLVQRNSILNKNNLCLDLAFTNFQCHINKAVTTLVFEDAYHPALWLECTRNSTSYSVKTSAVIEQSVPRLKFKKTDFSALYISLAKINWY
ncbi:uncharacterized protein LOC117173296 [Belonocnema kinseyi]|uniref:uncharacterized protein LOC117173296 n=1 Tax=Belonocnema kinseyi TaxID=2817044 RepID=UPI00143DC96C|nr:uncharacterized protein LOC117173296 [Belonocnema kinseyi]XP_033217670.1 uncharacterized protein LOC117173296 [Belonocnema kinseyi]XP_033217672.1 uncharacterized protein LOC117173296 [Belonocnema kinseyi]XP_033217673.1 uncharacterized protein LOC117173296 [Belonocnema kinseyi]